MTRLISALSISTYLSLSLSIYPFFYRSICIRLSFPGPQDREDASNLLSYIQNATNWWMLCASSTLVLGCPWPTRAIASGQAEGFVPTREKSLLDSGFTGWSPGLESNCNSMNRGPVALRGCVHRTCVGGNPAWSFSKIDTETGSTGGLSL